MNDSLHVDISGNRLWRARHDVNSEPCGQRGEGTVDGTSTTSAFRLQSQHQVTGCNGDTVCLSPDDRTLVVISWSTPTSNESYVLWRAGESGPSLHVEAFDVESGVKKWEHAPDGLPLGQLKCYKFSPDSKVLALSIVWRRVHFINVDTGIGLFGTGPTVKFDRMVFCLAFSPDCKSIALGTHDNTIILQSFSMHSPPVTTAILDMFRSDLHNPIHLLQFCQDGLLSTNISGRVIMWNLEGEVGEGRKLLNVRDTVEARERGDNYRGVAFDEGRNILLGVLGRRIILTDMTTKTSTTITDAVIGKPVCQYDGFSVGGSIFVSRRRRGVTIWNLETEKMLDKAEKENGDLHGDWFASACVSSDGSTVCTLSHDAHATLSILKSVSGTRESSFVVPFVCDSVSLSLDGIFSVVSSAEGGAFILV